jgi:hypothetical protein
MAGSYGRLPFVHTEHIHANSKAICSDGKYAKILKIKMGSRISQTFFLSYMTGKQE